MTPSVDVLIVGGGIAGLWTLDELRRRGYSALLVERDALGTGQTICAQGIIHGGLKYTLSGLLTPSADAIREMPRIWQECLEGRREPNLNSVRILSPFCYLWRTASLTSRMGMLGAQAGLRTPVVAVGRKDVPKALRLCPGDVFRVAEPVLDVASLLGALADRHHARLLRGEVVGVEADGALPVVRVTIAIRPGALIAPFLHPKRGTDFEPVQHHGDQERFTVAARQVVLTAGLGNSELRKLFNLPDDVMQRRPLHMVMARGSLPELFGHCIDGAKTRLTVTSSHDFEGRTVWNIGGEVAETGVGRPPKDQIEITLRELHAVLPGVDLSETQWATYRIDRAEGRTPNGTRPENPTFRRDGHVLTAWPTKLALAPRLASSIADDISVHQAPHAEKSLASFDTASARPNEGPDVNVAELPWNACPSWISY